MANDTKTKALKAATALKRKYLKDEFKKKGAKKAMPYGKWVLSRFKKSINQPHMSDDMAQELRKMK